LGGEKSFLGHALVHLVNPVIEVRDRVKVVEEGPRGSLHLGPGPEVSRATFGEIGEVGFHVRKALGEEGIQIVRAAFELRDPDRLLEGFFTTYGKACGLAPVAIFLIFVLHFDFPMDLLTILECFAAPGDKMLECSFLKL
jgi:hypothetical protein